MKTTNNTRPIDYGSITHRAALQAMALGCSGSLSAGPGWGPADCVDEDDITERQLPHLSVSPAHAAWIAGLMCEPQRSKLLALAVSATDVVALRRRIAADHPLDLDPMWRQRLTALLAACEVAS